MRSLRLVCLALAATGSLVACASIPLSGSVNHYTDQVQSGGSSASDSADIPGPVEGASPVEIVRGFLAAGSVSSESFAVAREFLSPKMAQDWKPDERTIVYSGDLGISSQGEDTVSVTLSTSAKIDSRGLATSFASGSEDTLNFTLERVEGQWRIKSAPDGLVLSQREFNETFAPFTLYFYDPSYTFLVPDVRWLPNRSSTVTSLVRLNLSGPAPYLEGAVQATTARQLELVRNAVPVSEGRAEIDVVPVGGENFELTQLEADRLKAQLEQTLVGHLGINELSLTQEGKVLSAGSSENFQNPQANPQLPPDIVGLQEGRILARSNYQGPASVRFSYPVDGELSHPAMGYRHKRVAVLGGQGTRLGLVSEEGLEWIHQGRGLAAPSFDLHGWVWTADQKGSLFAFKKEGELERVQVEAPWLEGIEVTNVNVSRDGARLVISGQSGQQSLAWVSGIVRDPETMEPLRISDPVRVSSGTRISVDWLSEDRVIVGDTATGRVEIVSLSGQRDALTFLANLDFINAGLGEEEIIATDTSGQAFAWNGQTWQALPLDLTDVNFSG